MRAAGLSAPAPIFTWTGLYLGGQIGYAWARQQLSFTNGGGFFPNVGAVVPLGSSPSGVIGGAHIGYNYQISQWVLGVEASVDATNYNGHAFGSVPLVPGAALGVNDNIQSSIQGSFRGRVGWALDRWLIYGTGGIAFTDFKNDYSGTVIADLPGLGTFNSRTRTLVGWTVGGGVEYAITPNWVIGANTAIRTSAVSPIPASLGRIPAASRAAFKPTCTIIYGKSCPGQG